MCPGRRHLTPDAVLTICTVGRLEMDKARVSMPSLRRGVAAGRCGCPLRSADEGTFFGIRTDFSRKMRRPGRMGRLHIL